MEKHYLGIDIGGTVIKTILLNEEGSVLEKNCSPTDDSSSKPNVWKQKIYNLISNYDSKYKETEDKSIFFGISAPGLTDKENRQILCMPERLKGIENLNWSEELSKDIYIINDGHAATLAEYESFHKSNSENMLLLTLGTGVGGGAILNGSLFQGEMNRAGHFGHITVDHRGTPTMTNMVGSLEHAIGNFSVRERTNNTFANTKELVEAYMSGNTLATYWWLNSIQKLATGIASLINSYSPELIVIGGGITEADNALFGPLKDFMNLYEWKPQGKSVKIIKANYGSYAGAMGAAYFAKTKEKK